MGDLLKFSAITWEYMKCFRYDESGKKNFVIEIIGIFFEYFTFLTHFYQSEEYIWQKTCNFVPRIYIIYNMDSKHLNRIKVALAEKEKTNKWLAEQLGKDQATISKWVTNTTQPNLEMLLQIAKVLEVNVNELVRPLE